MMMADRHENEGAHDPGPAGPGGHSRPMTPPGERPRVLIVEDDDAVRTVLGRALAHAGFEPVLAASVPEAENRVSASIAAMLVDFRLPGSRGDLFFYYASSRFPLLRRRTVFLSGDTSVEVEQLVSHTGCVLRHKPFVNASMIDLLKAMVQAPGGRRSDV